MKKVIKIKESKVLDIVNNIINEQGTAQNQPVSATGTIGTKPTFDGLKVVMQTLKKNVEKTLRGSTPYAIVTSKGDGVISVSGQGDNITFTVTLKPTTEEERHWYFDAALAIYSTVNTQAASHLRAMVVNKASEKSKRFSGMENEVIVLGRNSIGLGEFKGLDPNEPEKEYSLYIVTIGAKRPEGHQEVHKTEPTPQPTPAAPQPTQVTV